MGMAASQARLLMLTAQIHDIEYKAQSIQNAKVQLATQSDQVYQDYLAALDATTMTVTDTNNNLVTATFNNMVSKNAVDIGSKSYALFDHKGRLIVEDDVYEAYYDYKDAGFDLNDPYKFATYAINGSLKGEEEEEGTDANLTFDQDVTATYNQVVSDPSYYEVSDSTIKTLQSYKASMDAVLNKAVEAELIESDEDSDIMYRSLVEAATTDENAKELKEKYDDLNTTFKYQLFKCVPEELFNNVSSEEDEGNYDESLFDYYVNIFKQIQATGGCVSIDDYNGLDLDGDGAGDGDAANDEEWLKNMISCGKITIDTVSTNSKNGAVSFASTSTSSDSNLALTQTTTIDKTALSKAEAQYEHDCKQIDSKDKKYDLELSKLETERSALDTQYESVKKVLSKNIERTFGIFS